MANIFKRTYVPADLPVELRPMWLKHNAENPRLVKIAGALSKLKIKYDSPSWRGDQFVHFLLSQKKAAIFVDYRSARIKEAEKYEKAWKELGYRLAMVTGNEIDSLNADQIAEMISEWLK